MLDLRLIREDATKIKQAMSNKGEEADLDALLDLDRQRRELLKEVEELKHERNVVSKEIGKLKSQGQEDQEKIERMRLISDKIKNYDEKLRDYQEKVKDIQLRIPNLPDPEVPVGDAEEDNQIVRKCGEPPSFSFNPKPHWELGEENRVLDFEKAGRISGSRFVVYRDWGARLERALVNFMLDLHTEEHGYLETFPPFLVNRESMVGTGQLPKFAEDMYKVEGNDYYLIPTAEVPITNLHREEIINEADLPLYYVAYSACFRAEAGSHGRDTRGLIRQHQFNKVELVKFTTPDSSTDELETLVGNAEKVLQLLELPYRVCLMCTGDLGFAAAKKYDLEVWMPSSNDYREVSSCSNFRDFQARRANIRYRDNNKKTQFVHTLNGSGVAIGRTVAALLENFQQKDGSIQLPSVIKEYMEKRR